MINRTKVYGVPVVYEGDGTTTGGRVLEGTPLYIEYQRQVALKGHSVWCPACKVTGKIAEGSQDLAVKGVGVALHNYIVACGCPPGAHRVLAG